MIPYRALSLVLALSSPVPPEAAPPVRSARLERVSFTRSKRLPGIVTRLHFDGRVTAFDLEREHDLGRLRMSISGAGVTPGFACDDPPRPIVGCFVSMAGDRLEIEVLTSGPVEKADMYRDAAVRNDVLLYVHASAGAVVADRAPLPDAGADRSLNGFAAADSLDRAQNPATTAGDHGTVLREPDRVEPLQETPVTRISVPARLPAGNGTPGVAPPAGRERLAADAARLRIDTVALDAGHGGKDPGTIGYNRMREKDLVLDIALRVGAYLKQAGIGVTFTRDDDTFIDLKDRGRIAREAGGKLFVSIHANSARDRRARGTETFFLGRNKTEAARDVIERENQVIDLEEDRAHYEQFEGVQLARMRLEQSANLRQSQELAGHMQAQYRDRVGRIDRKVKEGNLYVLWSAGMPAILTEVGFISNPEEARFLGTERGKDYIASAIFRAIRDYIQVYERSLDLAEVR